MLASAVCLDASMTVTAALTRLAVYGFWLNMDHPAAQARLLPFARRLGRPVADVAARLARNPLNAGAAIRRQNGTQILWYARRLDEVLARCAAEAPETSLHDALFLRESGASPEIDVTAGETVLSDGVVMDGGRVIAVSLGIGASLPFRNSPPLSASLETSRGVDKEFVEKETAISSEVWPRIDAPDSVRATTPFRIEVGFGAAMQAGVVGAAVVLPAQAPGGVIEVAVELSAGSGVLAPVGWTRVMPVRLDTPLAASVTFDLVGVEPANSANPYLTSLEVRYVCAGTVCGAASRPLVVESSIAATMPDPLPHAPTWLDRHTTGTPVKLIADPQAPDLTVEISMPDQVVSQGRFDCTLYSPHALSMSRGPFRVDLGQDAKTYAKSIVEEIRLYVGDALLDPTIEGIGRLVAQRLPIELFDALREIAVKIAPAVPSVLIVSAEPYVPWELAWMEPALDSTRPRYLGAQAVLGRWLRDNLTTAASVAPRPAAHPNANLPVRILAVMAALYKEQAGLRRLPMAEKEAASIVKDFDGLALAASSQTVRALLYARLERGFDLVGGADAVHFAGHGDFDPTRPDSAALFLQDGIPLHSNVFRAAKYGGPRQPLMFLNACMLGVGGELLGDMGGFPGNLLRGGFGGVLGALWEVDDTVAHDIALEFWRRALPTKPGRGEPIGEILRDLRNQYVSDAAPAPISTFLSYVYYGHPRLTLERPSL